METEVKLAFKNKDDLYKLTFSDLFLNLFKGETEPAPVLLENTYLDTPDMKITKRGGMIRVRHYNCADADRYEFTVKYGGGVSDGLHRRYEWNVTSCDNAFSIKRFIDETNGSGDPEDVLLDVFGNINDDDLIVLCSNTFCRTVYNLSYLNSKVEACFDSGIIKNSDGSRSDEICELELELVSGDISELNAIAECIIETAECVPFDDTKYRRTLAVALDGHDEG